MDAAPVRMIFLITFPLEQQIRDIYLKYSQQTIKYEKQIEENDISDINRGLLARSIFSRNTGRIITLSANEDAAAGYKCTNKKPIYPLFVTVNNLPPKLRFDQNNLILASLWFNKGKPNMALFHKKFVLELQRLHNGMQIEAQTYKIVLLQCCLDSIGRCELFCSKQFNGRYGCTICMHPGKLVCKQMKYPYQRAKLREDVTTRRLMIQVEEFETREPRFGIKGLSVLVGLPEFDIIKGLPVDYTHMALLGITRTIWEILVENSSGNIQRLRNTSIVKKTIGDRFTSMRLPSSFSRRMRKPDEYLKFKASEWETILLHCIYPCLADLLPATYMNNVMMFATVVFLLLELNISRSTLLKCQKLMDQFVEDFEKLYGESFMLYNVHLSGHLVQNGRNLGALRNSLSSRMKTETVC
ncbi:uncharacterized protein LOC129718019 isoform X1 [Wyeomyia smithii]|uniref:uncharacterized protein LOC129718019 isoform X1 n=1 Tax=Wyeomyia smithii TaxID=174621 RepID=UPI002467AF98|nr:uncharacterized protein LOC129718019 isoform X1 [Wyeomyia smithii]